MNEYSVLGPRWSIRPKNEVPKHCTSSITKLLYTSIKLSISLNNIRFMYSCIIDNYHQIDRHSVHLHARIVILKSKSGHCDQQSCNKRVCNKHACNKWLYGTIASHDEVWQCIPWLSMTILLKYIIINCMHSMKILRK